MCGQATIPIGKTDKLPQIDVLQRFHGWSKSVQSRDLVLPQVEGGHLAQAFQAFHSGQLIGGQVEFLQRGEMNSGRAGELVVVEIQKLQAGQVLLV